MYEQVFRRDEKKYLLDARQKRKLMAKIGDKLKPDEYPEETICSLYFDTPTQDLTIQSIDKPVYKQKIRLRSYNVPSLEDDVFLEVKNKFRGIVSKRRFKIRLKDFYEYFDGKADLRSEEAPRIAGALDYLFKYYDLRPNWIVCYDRKSYRGREEADLRVTFDGNLRSRRDDLRLEKGDYGKEYFAEKMYVMEIKALDSLPLWLVRTFAELKIYPISFTKYGNIYKKFKKGEKC